MIVQEIPTFYANRRVELKEVSYKLVFLVILGLLKRVTKVPSVLNLACSICSLYVIL